MKTTATIKGQKVYLDKNNHWRFEGTNRMAPNPFSKRCAKDKCYALIRGKNTMYCPKHTNWKRTAHGASILTSFDVLLLCENYQIKSDMEIADVLIKRPEHKNSTIESLLGALRHHRRKYLINRYTKKYYYKTIKSKYRSTHANCEICGWSDGGVDVHHVWQVKDFENETDYHKSYNLISLCPNHHRFVEDMRRQDREVYTRYIAKYGR